MQRNNIAIVFLLLFLLINSCTTQVLPFGDTFDPKFFKKKNKFFKIKEIKLKDSTHITLAKSDKIYEQIIRKNNSPYEETIIYSLKTLKKIGGGFSFYDFRIGVWKNKDDNGNIIYEENYEEGYTFSVEDLAKKFSEEYGVNILVYKNVAAIQRNVSSNYIIVLLVKSLEDYSWFEIDGRTGETLVKKKAKDIEYN